MGPPWVGAPGSGYPPQQVKSLPMGGGIVLVSVFVCKQLFFRRISAHVTQPILTGPLLNQPILTQPILTQPILTQPILTRPRLDIAW